MKITLPATPVELAKLLLSLQAKTVQFTVDKISISKRYQRTNSNISDKTRHLMNREVQNGHGNNQHQLIFDVPAILREVAYVAKVKSIKKLRGELVLVPAALVNGTTSYNLSIRIRGGKPRAVGIMHITTADPSNNNNQCNHRGFHS